METVLVFAAWLLVATLCGLCYLLAWGADGPQALVVAGTLASVFLTVALGAAVLAALLPDSALEGWAIAVWLAWCAVAGIWLLSRIMREEVEGVRHPLAAAVCVPVFAIFAGAYACTGIMRAVAVGIALGVACSRRPFVPMLPGLIAAGYGILADSGVYYWLPAGLAGIWYPAGRICLAFVLVWFAASGGAGAAEFARTRESCRGVGALASVVMGACGYAVADWLGLDIRQGSTLNVLMSGPRISWGVCAGAVAVAAFAGLALAMRLGGRHGAGGHA